MHCGCVLLLSCAFSHFLLYSLVCISLQMFVKVYVAMFSFVCVFVCFLYCGCNCKPVFSGMNLCIYFSWCLSVILYFNCALILSARCRPQSFSYCAVILILCSQLVLWRKWHNLDSLNPTTYCIVNKGTCWCLKITVLLLRERERERGGEGEREFD